MFLNLVLFDISEDTSVTSHCSHKHQNESQHSEAKISSFFQMRWRRCSREGRRLLGAGCGEGQGAVTIPFVFVNALRNVRGREVARTLNIFVYLWY
jgi:hypothetical protein